MEGGDGLADRFFVCTEDLLDDMFEGLVIEVGFGGVGGEEFLEGLELHERAYFVQGFEAAKGLEFAKGNGDFGLVVWVCEVCGVLLMELAGEILVGVDLEGESFCDREDFGEIWELGVAEFLDDVLADQLFWVLVDDILEILAVECVGWELWVCAIPPVSRSSISRT